jgi:hypothetical protein
MKWRSKRRPGLPKGRGETNTTRLIGQWSMDGAGTDLHGGFGSAAEIPGAVAEQNDEPVARPNVDPLLVKPAGGDDWQPLLAGSA